MSEVEQPESVETSVKYGTVQYERKVSDGDYGHTIEGIYLPFVVVVSEGVIDVASTITNAIAARTEAAGLVLNNLGIPFEFNEDGTLVERAKAKPKPVSVESAAASFGGEVVSSGQTNTPAPSGGLRILKRQAPNPDWLQAQWEEAKRKHPEITTELYDNRGEGGEPPEGRRPWFKCKTSKVGIWPPASSVRCGGPR